MHRNTVDNIHSVHDRQELPFDDDVATDMVLECNMQEQIEMFFKLLLSRFLWRWVCPKRRSFYCSGAHTQLPIKSCSVLDKNHTLVDA